MVDLNQAKILSDDVKVYSWVRVLVNGSQRCIELTLEYSHKGFVTSFYILFLKIRII